MTNILKVAASMGGYGVRRPAGPHDCRYLSVMQISLCRHPNRRSAPPARPARDHPRPAPARQIGSIVPSPQRVGPAARLGPAKKPLSPGPSLYLFPTLALPCDAPRSAGGWPQARPEAPEWTGDAPHREFRWPWAGDLSQWAMPGGRRCVEMRRGE
jgi:hypothetical protein